MHTGPASRGKKPEEVFACTQGRCTIYAVKSQRYNTVAKSLVVSFPPSQLFAVLHTTRLVHSTLIKYVPSADPRRIRTKDVAPRLPTTTAFPNRTVVPASESAFPFLLYRSDSRDAAGLGRSTESSLSLALSFFIRRRSQF